LARGKKLYETKYDTTLLMKLLAGRNREKYGETKVIEIDLSSWDGDISKLSEKSVKGLLAILRAEAARQEAEQATREAKVVKMLAVRSATRWRLQPSTSSLAKKSRKNNARVMSVLERQSTAENMSGVPR
jgi:hypothetical protein